MRWSRSRTATGGPLQDAPSHGGGEEGAARCGVRCQAPARHGRGLRGCRLRLLPTCRRRCFKSSQRLCALCLGLRPFRGCRAGPGAPTSLAEGLPMFRSEGGLRAATSCAKKLFHSEPRVASPSEVSSGSSCDDAWFPSVTAPRLRGRRGGKRCFLVASLARPVFPLHRQTPDAHGAKRASRRTAAG